MCDTLVALGSATKSGAVIFAKNSDREPNEAQSVEIVPAQDHPEGAQVKCTYVSIPQVEHTHRVLLSRPFWMWGAEMGANEHGVVIGNEAVFTRVPYEKGPALTGMDLLRLALERAASALDALRVITSLLEEHGQGGNCGLTHGFYYHNSFLIADTSSAWVLETAGRHWAAEQVRDMRTISNAITIGGQWDLASADLVSYAVSRGWCRGREDFDFARCYSDPLYTRLSDAHPRQCSTMDGLRAQSGQVTVESAMQMLRSHRAPAGKAYRPDTGVTGADVCMHAGWGPVRNSQSAGSLVAEIRPEGATYWVTGTSAPCTGVFHPVWLDAGMPEIGPTPAGRYDRNCLWWQHELLHREVLRDYTTRLAKYAPARDALEAEFLAGASGVEDAEIASRFAYSQECFARARERRAEWLAQVRDLPLSSRLKLLYALAWRKFNQQAGLA